ncbi:Intramolecular chaperone auto-processing domain containing protein [uncultured Caudovirales phage]|uniref:Intramolecular chaperone auto-processing domain containing protein n=1 Tax=uncultured Caudovirales phage TaxID=2100421 RepID=A0A6J5RPQ2_9CAUD|nr:Intramolecular chaperone auto-processing domain containing protein [uncultured Caudovirales phage]
MSSTINATTVGVGGVVTTADNSGILVLQTASTTALTISAAQGVTLAGTLGVTGATTLSTTLGVTGATTLSSTLGVTGATTLSSTLGVTGATTLSTGLTVTGGRSQLAANSETFALGVKYSAAGGSYYFGAASASATPDGVFSQAGGSERMRITDGGNLLVGTTDNADTTGVGIKLRPTGNQSAFVNTSSTGSDNNLLMYSTGAAAYRFYVGWDGTVHATNATIASSSDITLKENIKDIETGLLEVMELQPRRFDWKNGDGVNVAGFIAQEVEKVLPDLVIDAQYNETETKKSLLMGMMIPTMVKAIQELKAIIDTQAARITALETL